MISSRKKMFQGISQVETITLIVVCILLYTQPNNLVYFSNTILGKLLLVTSLVLATIHSTFSGFCIAMLIIVFSYQTYEGLESGKGMKSSGDSSEAGASEAGASEAGASEAGASEKQDTAKESKLQESTIAKIDEENKNNKEDAVDTGIITTNKFKKLYCKDNKLRNKSGEIVEKKDISSVFKNIVFNNGECNPCDETCSFNITETGERMNTEENLRPADSNKLPIVK